MFSDETGHFPILISLLIGLGIGLASEFVGDLIDDGEINRGWQDYLGAGVAGLIGGLGRLDICNGILGYRRCGRRIN